MISTSSSASSTRLRRIIRSLSINILWVREIEVDAVCDGTDILIPGIMEHIERTGVHPVTVSLFIRTEHHPEIEARSWWTTRRSWPGPFCVKGMINIQFIVSDNEVYIIEVNPVPPEP